jgi:hypothetical protein
MIRGEDGVVDVRRQVVVVDEDAHPGPRGRPRGEYVESEMERPILRDVVVRRRIGKCESGDPRSVACLDDRPEPPTFGSIGAVGGDVEVSMVGARRMRDVGRGRVVEQVPKRRTAVNGHTPSLQPDYLNVRR